MVVKIDSSELEAWARDLGRVEFEKAIKKIHRDVGLLIVAEAEVKRRSLSSRYPSYDRVTIRSSLALSGAAITVGPREVGFAGEFGAYVHPVFGRFQGQTSFGRKVWPLWSGSGDDAGYLAWPALRENETQVAAAFDRGLSEAMKPAFPEIQPAL